MVDSTYERLDCDTPDLEQAGLFGSKLSIGDSRRPSHYLFQRESPSNFVAKPVRCQDRVDSRGGFKQAANVDVCGIVLGERLQARVKKKRGEQFERSAANEGEATVVTFTGVEVRLMRYGSKCQLSVGAEKIRGCGGEGR